MHLMEILALRQVTGAGVYLTLTRRCPLTCRHCSTNSLMTSEQHGAASFLSLVDSFTPDCRPDVVVLTGGEPLLRPRLVQDLASRAHAVGSRVVLASGMFWARQSSIPPAIDEAIAAVDHMSVSLDVFHEEQVPRDAVLRAVMARVERGMQASFLVVGMDGADPYLADVIADIRRFFEDRVPILVGFVRAVGRAADWMPSPPSIAEEGGAVEPLPCDLAAWPVVSPDGTVVGCCNQAVIDGPAPAHLRLGHAAGDTWSRLVARHRSEPLMRAVRVFGPVYTATAYGAGAVTCDGYCSTCMRLSDDPQLARRAAPAMTNPAMGLFEDHVAGLQQERFLQRHAPAGYEGLVRLGFAQPVA